MTKFPLSVPIKLHFTFTLDLWDNLITAGQNITTFPKLALMNSNAAPLDIHIFLGDKGFHQILRDNHYPKE